jgi:hypothetical protein
MLKGMDKQRTLIVCFAVALLLRLLLAFTSPGNFDTSSYIEVARILQQGANVYAETARYNYSPLWFNLIHLFAWADVAFLPLIARAFLSLIDMANVALVWKLAGWKAALFYAFSPAVILIVGHQGQFETLSLLPLLLAVTTKDKRLIFALGALAVLVKHNSVFLVWVLFVHTVGFKRAALWMVASAALFLLSFAPYLPDGAEGIVRNVFRYNGIPDGGIAMLLPASIISPLFYALMLIAPLGMRSLALRRALALTTVLQLTFMPAIAMQYFLMPVLLLALAQDYKLSLSVSLTAALYVLLERSDPAYLVIVLTTGCLLWQITTTQTGAAALRLRSRAILDFRSYRSAFLTYRIRRTEP